MPFLDQRFAALSIGGLALQAVGSVFLFNGMSVSLPLIVVMIAIALLYHRFALLRILAVNRNAAPAMLDDQPLVGTYGYVQRALDPVGTVYVRGESWTARSDHKLKAGTEITVVDQVGSHAVRRSCETETFARGGVTPMEAQGVIIIVLVLFIVYLAVSIVRVVPEYERLVVLSLGKYAGTRGPGITHVHAAVGNRTQG